MLVFASIVIGVAVTEILTSLHRLLRHRALVRWDWLPLAVALLVLLTLVQTWWSIAQPSQEATTIGQFVPILVELIMLFLLAAACLPDLVDESGLDLTDYYKANHSYIWTLYALNLGWALATGAAQASNSFAGFVSALADRSADFVFVGVMASLALTERRWWHIAALALLSVGPILWMSRSLS